MQVWFVFTFQSWKAKRKISEGNKREKEKVWELGVVHPMFVWMILTDEEEVLRKKNIKNKRHVRKEVKWQWKMKKKLVWFINKLVRKEKIKEKKSWIERGKVILKK